VCGGKDRAGVVGIDATDGGRRVEEAKCDGERFCSDLGRDLSWANKAMQGTCLERAYLC
jgi:hypothetical protein